MLCERIRVTIKLREQTENGNCRIPLYGTQRRLQTFSGAKNRFVDDVF